MYYSQIERAIEHAPLVAVGESRATDSEHPFRVFADAPDDYVITIKVDEDQPLSHVSVEPDHNPGFRLLLDQSLEVTGGTTMANYSDFTDSHERQHLYAAEFLGGDSNRLTLAFYREQRPNGTEMVRFLPQLEPTWIRTTKLGLAVIAAFPETPSEGDMTSVRALGYEDTADVARRVLISNQEGDIGTPLYPLPLSVLSSASSNNLVSPNR